MWSSIVCHWRGKLKGCLPWNVASHKAGGYHAHTAWQFARIDFWWESIKESAFGRQSSAWLMGQLDHLLQGTLEEKLRYQEAVKATQNQISAVDLG